MLIHLDVELQIKTSKNSILHHNMREETMENYAAIAQLNNSLMSKSRTPISITS